ncbi:MAG TPA: TSUP family transporter, partial [Verrucomicrobiales bacterium]|nr:TSUP family transporter [Verrucomicrobiales bacterium]
MEWWHYVLLMFSGLAAGFIDAVAGGGGLITVPALLWAGLPPGIALGTNKMQSCCGTALAVRNYARAGLIQWRDVRAVVFCTLVFAALGAQVL